MANKILTDRFDYCMSLGWYCGTASALSRLGLRSVSGPFDWYFSTLDSVLKIINNRFSDFMSKENLEMVPDKPKEFIDKKYGFHCNHDVEISFEQEVNDICLKYARRASRFLELTKMKICFFYMVKTSEEIAYIIDNNDYIENTIKSLNPYNHIVYVTLNNMPPLSDKQKFYVIDRDQHIGKTYEMRHMFDSNTELVSLCGSLLDESTIKSNREFDFKTNEDKIRGGFIKYKIENNYSHISNSIVDYLSIESTDDFYVWGAGQRGLPMAKYLLHKGLPLKAIIDNNNKKNIDLDLPIILPSEVPNNAKILIAVVKDYEQEIIEQIYNQIGTKNYMTYKDIDIDISNE